MNWNASISNPKVAAAYAAYKGFVMSVATHYAGSRLMEHVEIEGLGHDSKLALSDDFSEGFTTIRTVGDLAKSMRSGEYGQLCLRLATVQLCTAFEIFFDAVSDIYSVAEGKAPISATYNAFSPNEILLGNKAIKQIRKLHDKLGIWSVTNNDEVLVKLTAIIEVRNCIVHTGGRVAEPKVAERLRAYAIHHKVGEIVNLHNNLLDDFLHYMAIHVVAFVKKLP